MPLQKCTKGDKPGWRFGDAGACYAYTAGDDASEKRAKKAAIRQAIAIGGGKAPTDLHSYAEYADELETVDLEGVAIMESAFPARGQGSAPGGDVYDDPDLDTIAADTNDVLDELRPFVKISHSKEQRLAKASGLYLDDGETPATGWLHNLRRDAQGLLRTDIRAMPRKLARLVETGAFRLRSPELRPFKTADGATKPLVVQALALEGAKPVAFKTLDDIYALYHDTPPPEPLVVAYGDEFEYAEWDASYVNDLPDSAFLYVAPGGKKDDDGKTTPRSLRYFPVRDKNGDVDVAHVRNALARIPQSDVPDAAQTKATAKAQKMLKQATGGSDNNEVVYVDYQADVVWDPEKGAQDLMSDLGGELNGPGGNSMGNSMGPTRFWVQDIDTASAVALVCDYSGSEPAYWIVPYTIGDDGDPDPAPRDEWTQVQQAWVAASAEERAEAYAEGLVALAAHGVTVADPAVRESLRAAVEAPVTIPGGARDTRPQMDPKALAQKLGLAEDATDEQILAKLDELNAGGAGAGDGSGAAGTAGASGDGVKQMSEDEYKSLVDMATAGARAEQLLYTERRDGKIDDAIRKGKLVPADREKWVKRYDEAPTVIGEIIDGLPIDEKLVRSYGSDEAGIGTPGGDRETVDDERAYAAYCALNGIEYIPNQAIWAAAQNGGGQQ